MQAESAGAEAPAFFARLPLAGSDEENDGMKTGRRAFTMAALAALGAPFVARAQRDDAQSPHKALYLYQGAGREERLAAEARKQGEVVMYTSLNLKDSVPITEAFEKATRLKVQLWRASSEKVLQRAVAEARAGRFACDIIETNGPEMEAAHREKLLEEFYSPHFRDLPAAAFPKHRHYVADRFNFFTIGYNTSLVKPEEVPKAYEDADSRPQIRTGHTLMGELVASGEIPLAATIYNHNIERLALKGAPVQWKALNPTFGRPNAIGVARHAPHPHAAMLFVDFMLSKEGQTLIRDRNRVPASLSVETRLNKFPFHMIDPVITLDENDRWEKLWIDLFLKGRKVQKEAE